MSSKLTTGKPAAPASTPPAASGGGVPASVKSYSIPAQPIDRKVPIGNSEPAQEIYGNLNAHIENQGRAALVDGVARDRRKGDFDAFDLSRGGTVNPEEFYNHAGPDRVLKAVISDEWAEKYGTTSTLDDVMYGTPGAQIVTRKRDNRPVKHSDIVMISIPRAVQEAYDRESNAEAEAYSRHVSEETSGTLEGNVYSKDKEANEAAMHRISEANRRNFHASKMTGEMSITRGHSYERAIQLIPERERLEREAQLRRGNRHVSLDEREKEISDRIKSGAKGTTGSGRFVFGGLTGKTSKEGGYDNWERTGDKAKAGKR